MMSNRHHGTLYVGVTNDLLRRTAEHRDGVVPGFSKRYGLKRLVWYETHDSVEAAIRREKLIKRWSRPWKVRLIEAGNPEWGDLVAGLSG